MGSFEDFVQAEVRRRAPTLQVDRLEVRFLAEPDKCDPLNSRAMMTAKADINGRASAWIVEGPNGEPGATATRLWRALASAIVERPEQTPSQANMNIVKLD
jgi:hypothetical protein